MFDFVLKIVIFLSTTMNLNFMPQNIFDLYFYEIAVLLLLAISLTQKPIRQIKFSKMVIVPIVMCIVQFFIYKLNPYSFQYFICYGLGLVFIYTVVRHVEDIRGIARWIIYSAVFNVLYLLTTHISYKYGYQDIFIALDTYVPIQNIKNIGACMGNQIRLMYLMCIAIPLFSIYGFKTFFVAGIAFSSIGFFIYPDDYQMNALLVFLITLFVLASNKQKGIMVLSCIAFLIYAYYFQHDEWTRTVYSSITVRIEYWIKVIKQVFSHPMSILCGRGVDIISGQLLRDPNKDWSTLSSYLFFIGGFGVFGLFFILRFLYSFIKTFKKSPIHLSFLGILVLCLFEYVFEIRRLHIDLFSLISILIIMSQRRKNNGLEPRRTFKHFLPISRYFRHQ